MISYPLDFSKPWVVLRDDKERQELVINVHTKTIHTSDGTFADTVMALISYKDLKLNREDKAKARYATRTGNNDLLKSVYENVITSHSLSKNK